MTRRDRASSSTSDVVRERRPEPRSVRFGRRDFLAISAATTAAVTLPAARALADTTRCHPTRTEPAFRGRVPTPTEALGFEFGVAREVGIEEAYRYLDIVGSTSDRVRIRTYGRSTQGRPLRYAIVGRPEHISSAGLASVRRAHAAIRDPDTSTERVRELARSTPAFLWVAANIHGNEESGTDASLEVLHGLADRTDCVVDGILRNAVVIVIPMQNPDGRALHTRRNAYAFDLNRDHLSRTQPESDSKVELLRTYPPLLLLDHHEFGYYPAFFPPNDDPVYHEITDETLHLINDVYGPAIAREFERNDWKYFNRGKGYDFFSPIFTDTITSDGFQGAGMTIEVYNGAPIRKRFLRQRAVMWVSLAAAASRKRRILQTWHRSFVEAVDQGRRGHLLPNKVFEATSDLRVEVPTTPLRHYFIRTDGSSNVRHAKLLARALQRMDVRIHELEGPLAVPDYRPHTLAPRAETLPAGTYWIPMEQPQKHWIQATMNEDAYVPIASAYGLTGFSLGLLSGAD
ncbi:MAG: M14 family zinc carboxypeptidase, partial [Actinomycetota bacterium]